jgi:hypothetical protein
MHLASLKLVALDFFHFDLKLLSKELAIRLGSIGILLNDSPKLFVVKEGLPLGLFGEIERMVERLFFVNFVGMFAIGGVPFLFLFDDVEDVLADPLVVFDEVAFHDGDPFVFGGREVAQTHLPKQGPHGVVLIDQPVTIESVVVDCTAVGGSFLFLEIFRLNCDFIP